MLTHLIDLLLFAQDEGANPEGGLTETVVRFFPFIMIMFLLYFMLIRPQRREQQSKAEMVNSLKKNDRVVTIGGLIATVASVSAEGKEITLKVDENTRLKFLKSAISQKLDTASEDEAS